MEADQPLKEDSSAERPNPPQGEDDSNDDNIVIVGGGENHALLTLPSSTLTLPKSSLGDIEEETEGDLQQKEGNKENETIRSDQHGEVYSPVTERASSALPRSRTGNGSRGRWHSDGVPSRGDGLPNSSSTNFSTIGPSRGLDDFDQPETWSNSRGSQMYNSPLSSPAFSPSPGLSPEPGRKSRIQIKDHGPVAKWLAKRQKKKEEEPPKSRAKSRGPKKYAPHIQPKVNTRNNEYQPSVSEIQPVKSEKLAWNAKSVVQTHNDWYRPAASAAVDKQTAAILNEKLHWDAQTKVDMWNRDYKPSAPKKFQVFSEKLQWYEQPKVSTSNPGYAPPPSNQQVPIVDEELQWAAKPKVDTYNTTYKAAKPSNASIFHQSPQWKAHSKTDHTRPHYMPSGGGNIRVKTDKLLWSSEAKVDTFNPSYVHTKSNNTDHKQKIDNVKSPKDSNGWSSHSSDSETEWYSSIPGSENVSERKYTTKGSHKQQQGLKADMHIYQGEPSDRAIVWHPRKVLFNSKDLVDDAQQMTRGRYPVYKSQTTRDYTEFSAAKKVPPIRSFSTYNSNKQNSFRKDIKKEKSKRVFKEMTDPLPPVGTFSHPANEAVYPERRSYIGHRAPPRAQKIELIDMEDLSLLSRKARHTVFIN